MAMLIDNKILQENLEKLKNDFMIFLKQPMEDIRKWQLNRLS